MRYRLCSTQVPVLVLVLVLVLALSLGSTEASENYCREEFDCILCDSTDPSETWCLDPFLNDTMRDQTSKHRCQTKQACVKWIIQERQDSKVRVIRSCYEKLDVRFTIHHVCISEIRSGVGQLCFCPRSFCNGATSLSLGPSLCLCLSVLTGLLFSRLPLLNV